MPESQPRPITLRPEPTLIPRDRTTRDLRMLRETLIAPTHITTK